MLSKKINQVILFLFVLGMGFSSISCSKKSIDVADIEGELKSEFGDNAHYTNINIIFDNTIGTMITTIVSKEAKDLKMEEWSSIKGTWELKSEVSLEIEGEATPEQFKFNLNNDVSFTKIAALAESAKQQIIKEKKIEDVVVKTITILAPDDQPKEQTQIIISIEPSKGGTSYTFFYDMKGNFKSMS